MPLLFWGSQNFRSNLATGDLVFKLLINIDYTDRTTTQITSSSSQAWLVSDSAVRVVIDCLSELFESSVQPRNPEGDIC